MWRAVAQLALLAQWALLALLAPTASAQSCSRWTPPVELSLATTSGTRSSQPLGPRACHHFTLNMANQANMAQCNGTDTWVGGCWAAGLCVPPEAAARAGARAHGAPNAGAPPPHARGLLHAPPDPLHASPGPPRHLVLEFYRLASRDGRLVLDSTTTVANYNVFFIAAKGQAAPAVGVQHQGGGCMGPMHARTGATLLGAGHVQPPQLLVQRPQQHHGHTAPPTSSMAATPLPACAAGQHGGLSCQL